MKRFLLLSLFCFVALFCYASIYKYRFQSEPIPAALTTLVKDHPGLKISFIYNELEDYSTTCNINTDDIVDAVRKIIGINPVRIHMKGNHILVEALQKGKYHYTGRAIGENGEGVAYATVLMMNPSDSAVVTYGIADRDGFFRIPCDSRNLLAKLSSIGYKVEYVKCRAFALGNIKMTELPVSLGNIVVAPDDAMNYPDRTVFIPNSREKNASQNAIDLLARLPMPQIMVNPIKETVETSNGKSVAIYIDGMPCEKGDVNGMNMQDVKKVEYLEFPKDPRFQGKPYVVNFIMQQYEYGGYAKVYAYENFAINSGMFQANNRIQYKKMRYDVMAYGFYHNSSHIGQDRDETYRLLQPDGEIKTFKRESDIEEGKSKRQQYYASFRAVYDSDNFTASSTVSGSIDRMPHNDRKGSVKYTPDLFKSSDYNLIASNLAKNLNYSGQYNFKLDNKNFLVLSSKYSYSHTVENSSYKEVGVPDICNGARDNTNELFGMLSYQHNPNNIHSFNFFIRSSHDSYQTHYSGSANSYEKSNVTTFGGGGTYFYGNGVLYGSVGIGWDSYWSKINEISEKRTNPWLDFSLQYTVRHKSTLSLVFHHSIWPPSPSYRSENIVKANHLMSYTGNPSLVPQKSYDIGLSYRFMPDNKFSLSMYVYDWIVDNRYVYDYESSSEGILRTIKQPMGSYSQYTFGMRANFSILDRSLRFAVGVVDKYTHNGNPYNWDKSKLSADLSAYYYLGNFNFGAYYSFPEGSSDGFMVGKWVTTKSSYMLMAGWSDSNWNIAVKAVNFCRWNWKDKKYTETSRYYDNIVQEIGIDSHAYFNVGVTYTFGYGKKVERGSELQKSGGASSGILK